MSILDVVGKTIDAVRADRTRWRCRVRYCDGLPHEGWPHKHARYTQHQPRHFRLWLILTGRGWGKTRTATEAIKERCDRAKRPLHICVIGKNDAEVRNVCFEHRKSGLLKVFGGEKSVSIVNYKKGSANGDLVLTVRNAKGVVHAIRGFSAETPDNIRGYDYDGTWGDEFAAWPSKTAQDALDQAWLAMRETADPFMIITTTPKNKPHMVTLLNEALASLKESVITRGTMFDNIANLSRAAIKELKRKYDGRRLGRQELDGELLEDVEGALWTREMLEQGRASYVPPAVRRVIGIDPSDGNEEGKGDAYGWCVASRGEDGVCYIEASGEFRGLPLKMAEATIAKANQYRCDAIVVEKNHGGKWLLQVLQGVDEYANIEPVHASDGKYTRAEPVAALFAKIEGRGQIKIRARMVGNNNDGLEDEFVSTSFTSGERSPNQLDAAVWAVSKLMLTGREAQEIDGAIHDDRLAGRR